MSTDDSVDLASAAERSAQSTIVGGRLNQLVWPEGRRPVIARGEGARLWDVDGREFIDFVLGSGPLVLGHAHPKVVEAVRHQAGLGSTFYALSPPIVELAERIVEWVPCAERVQFSTTGGEATAYALRLARAATGRELVLKFEGGYHGGHDYAQVASSVLGAPELSATPMSSHGIPEAVAETVIAVPFNDAEAATQAIERHADRLAAIILEPVQRTLPPEPGFLETLRALADRHGLVLIFDEIVTGFRLARGGAQEVYGVVPDLATVGKVLGGGYALAAVCGRADIMELLDHERRGRDRYAFMSGTLNGNPLSAAAGNATLKVLDEPGAYERLHEVGRRLRDGLAQACADAERPAELVGVGPLFQILFADRRPTDARGVAAGDAKTARALAARCFDEGLYLSADKGYLSLAHTDEQIDRAVEVYADALALYSRE
jgi:glutamate-1-semialdehyde 2,1-aminomutase